MVSLILLYLSIIVILNLVSLLLGDFPYFSILAQQIFGLMLPALVYSIIHNESYLTKNDLKTNVITGFTCLIAGGLQQLVCSLINFPFVILWDKLEVTQNSVLPVPNGTELFWYIPLISVLPAVTEEVVFRKITFRKLSAYNKKFSLVATAVIFALFHFDIYSVVPLIMTGLILSYIVYKGQNLICTSLFHFGFNFMGIALGLIQQNEMGSKILNNHFLTLSVTALIFVIIFLINIEVKKDDKKNSLDF